MMRGHNVYVDIEFPDEDSPLAAIAFRPDRIGEQDNDFTISESFDDLIAFVDRLKERLVEAKAEYDGIMEDERQADGVL